MVHKVTHDVRGTHMTISDHSAKPIPPNTLEKLQAANRVHLAAAQIREKSLIENVEHPTKQTLQQTMKAHESKMRQLGIKRERQQQVAAPTTLQLRMKKLQDEVGFLEEMNNRRPPSVMSTRLVPLNRLQMPHDNWRRLLVTRERPPSQQPLDEFAEPMAKLTGRIAELEHQLHERAQGPPYRWQPDCPHPVGENKVWMKTQYRYEPRADLTDSTANRYRAQSPHPFPWVQSDATRRTDLPAMMQARPTLFRSTSTDCYRPFATVPNGLIGGTSTTRNGRRSHRTAHGSRVPEVSPAHLEMNSWYKRRADEGSLAKFGDIRVVHDLVPKKDPNIRPRN